MKDYKKNPVVFKGPRRCGPTIKGVCRECLHIITDGRIKVCPVCGWRNIMRDQNEILKVSNIIAIRGIL